jgi:glyoxalase family protein
VTAIASDPQRNLDYYTEVLGMRLVQRTVTLPGGVLFELACLFLRSVNLN